MSIQQISTEIIQQHSALRSRLKTTWRRKHSNPDGCRQHKNEITMKRALLLTLALASATVFADSTVTAPTIDVGAKIEQSGEFCHISLRTIDAPRPSGVGAPKVDAVEISKKCSQFVSAGLVSDKNKKLAFTARAQAMTANEFRAAAARLSD
jgi:hypothetical protein